MPRKRKKSKAAPVESCGAGDAAPEEGNAERDAREQFVRDAIARGDAAELDEDGTLPQDATHHVTGRDAEGKPEIKRRRFNLR